MKRHADKKILYKWLDGELSGPEREACEAHLKACLSCRKDLDSLKAFHDLVQGSSHSIEPSGSFDSAFWKKAYEREDRKTWLSKARRSLESLFLVPNLSGAMAVLTIAFLIGSAGGAVSGLDAHGSESEPAATLSGSPEYRGIPDSSIAASYLKTIEGRTS